MQLAGPGPRQASMGAKIRPLVSQLESRQFSDSQILELDGRPLRFQAEVSRVWLAARATRDFLTVDPKPDLPIDGADVVVVPLVDTLTQSLGRKAPLSVGRYGRERRHLSPDRKDVTVRGIPIGLILPAVFEIEHLDLNALG